MASGGPSWKALKAVFSLTESPDRGHTLTGDLRGARSLEFSLPGGGSATINRQGHCSAKGRLSRKADLGVTEVARAPHGRLSGPVTGFCILFG